MKGCLFFIISANSKPIHTAMRKYLIYLIAAITAATAMTSCFGTSKSKDEEILRHKREQEARATDSIRQRRNTPDTTLARYKRSMFCDGKYMIVFDRVQLLSGEEAQEYAETHKRYGDVTDVVVNQKEVLETLPLSNEATIYMYRQPRNPGDSAAQAVLTRCYNDDVDDLEYDQVMELIIQHRTILYLKEMNYDKD